MRHSSRSASKLQPETGPGEFTFAGAVIHRRDVLKAICLAAGGAVLAGCGVRQAWRPIHPEIPEEIMPLPDDALAEAPAAAERLVMNPRTVWRAEPETVAKLNRMGTVTRLTLHHEGEPTPNEDTSRDQVGATLRRIQVEHRRRMNAGDIGYHYVIDRRGELWQGRSLHWQGAHVKAQNEGNIGIMLLGNFDLQSPTEPQLETLRRTVARLASWYKIPSSRLFLHSDLATTRCPGIHLRPRFSAFRDGLGGRAA